MNYQTKKAMQDWNNEVEEEMCRLIEEGTPPFDAAERARDIVSHRRRMKRDAKASIAPNRKGEE